MGISIENLIEKVNNRYEGIIIKNSYREIAIFYNPDNKLKNGVYVCTIKESDGPNDKSSKLDRDNLYRLSCGLNNDKYEMLFGIKPKRPSKGARVDLPFDFSEINVIMPHPIYAWMSWVCVNSPELDTLERFFDLIDCSYEKAKKSYATKMK